MNIKSVWAILCAFSGLALSACNDNVKSGDENYSSAYTILFDTSLTPKEKTLVRADLNRIAETEFTESNPQGQFQAVFSGASGTAVLNYLDERINLIFGPREPVLTRTFRPEQMEESDNQDTDEAPAGAVIMANNQGVYLWLTALTRNISNAVFHAKTKNFPISSPRVGLIQLGQGYSLAKTPDTKSSKGVEITFMDRLQTLVHEARHSDCTGGMERSRIENLKVGIETNVLDWVFKSSCGHPHTLCPQGHIMADLPACDNKPWGSYAVELIFASKFAKQCTKCSEAEKQIALAAESESLSRIMLNENGEGPETRIDKNMAVERIKKMLNFEYGRPDMSSLGIIEDR